MNFRNWIPRCPPCVRLCICGVILVIVKGAGNEIGAQGVRRAIDCYTQRRAQEKDRKNKDKENHRKTDSCHDCAVLYCIKHVQLTLIRLKTQQLLLNNIMGIQLATMQLGLIVCLASPPGS